MRRVSSNYFVSAIDDGQGRVMPIELSEKIYCLTMKVFSALEVESPNLIEN